MLDCFIDKDESTEPLKMIIPTYVDDSSRIYTESLFTLPDGSAPQLTPDFVLLHILAKDLNTPTNTFLGHRYERRAGYRIIQECCPVIMEGKSFPRRMLKPAERSSTGRSLLDWLMLGKNWGFSVTIYSKSMSMLFGHWWLPHLATTGPTVLLNERKSLGVWRTRWIRRRGILLYSQLW